MAGASADLLYVRTYSGTLKEGAVLMNSRTGEKVRARQLLRLYAKNTQSVSKVGPGDIIGMIGPRDCETGDALCDPRRRISFEQIIFPEPVLSVAVEPKSSRDKDRLDAALQLLCREDPTLQLGYDEDTGQRLLSGMGELHLNVSLKRLRMEARVGEPRVAYRETFKAGVEVHYVFSRTLGDTELFAEITAAFRPLSRGDEFFRVKNSIPSRNVLPKAFVAAAEKALADGMRTGGGHGNPLIYVEAELLDLNIHPEKTTEPAVIGAALGAVDQAIRETGTVVLEPVMRLEIFAPEESIGEVTGYLQPRRALIHEMGAVGSVHRIVCEVPLAEMFGFGKALPKLTGGRGMFTMVPCGYQPIPPELSERLFGPR
jgi:elongation factor G